MIRPRLAAALWLLAAAGPALAAPEAVFEAFEYQGADPVFEPPPPPGRYQNPIIAGYHPDPSIVRVGADFYMVHSSFAHFPALPVYHSRNLVDWRLIGHVFDDPERLDLAGLGTSRGLFAPTIRHHEGRFYVVGTVVDGGGNFVVTAEDPAGPWSAPVWLPEVDGIDPDLFFDDDGRAWLTHNGPPPGEPRWPTHRAIWQWAFDPEALRVLPGSAELLVDGGSRPEDEPAWVEGPHLYKIDGRYYLLCAEGGTEENHSEVVFRADHVRGPYRPYPGNPILTQRDLPPDRPAPIANTGHADLVQTPAGEWWAVFLGVRPYDAAGHFNTGRETFLLPVQWLDGWPRIVAPATPVPWRPPAPRGLPATPGAEATTGNFRWRDDFDGPRLSGHWVWLRGGDARDWARLADGRLILRARADRLDGRGRPAFLGRRQAHTRFSARLTLRPPAAPGLRAGLAVYYDEGHHDVLGLRRLADGRLEARLERADGGPPRMVARRVLAATGPIELAVDGRGRELAYAAGAPGRAEPLGAPLDARALSTVHAGGFVGVILGPYAHLETEGAP